MISSTPPDPEIEPETPCRHTMNETLNGAEYDSSRHHHKSQLSCHNLTVHTNGTPEAPLPPPPPPAFPTSREP
uniref:SFRICE_006332 n=1 Tax=Spodoptera frugiperda TaxID=7108 RepID=A0A2H1V7J3_SPOFR